MTDHGNSTEIEVKRNYDVQLYEFEAALLNTLSHLGLPTESILVSVKERLVVSRNIENVLVRVDPNKRLLSTYISKFIAATGAGLFDAALNYLWDETISELRQRVAQYDISYFCDNAGISQEKQKKINSAADLMYIDDSELIRGARKIELISELGFMHLDYIRYMRNWASAAHPNQNEITGLQLISWLETCIKEVISLPLSDVVVEIKEILFNVKTKSISTTDAREIAAFFHNLTQDKVSNLALGFFGIYTQPDTTSQTRQNIHQLLPHLWGRVDDATRKQIGVKYGKFAAIGNQEGKGLARQFLELVSALSYIPDDLRSIEIVNAVENLLNAHRMMNNFYNEPPFARELQRLVGQVGKLPSSVNKTYVLGLVEVFLTNGNGVAWNAESIYCSLIELFDPTQALIAILSFSDMNIASMLQFPLCQTKYRELLEMLKINVSAPAVKELINDIEAFKGPLNKLKDDSKIKDKVANLQKIIG